MFDRIIYKILDTVMKWCEKYKQYRIYKNTPRPNKKELAKWVKQREKSYK